MALLWICLAKVSQGNKIWQGCEYARDAQGAEYICLNKPDYALIMSQYARICLNTPPPPSYVPVSVAKYASTFLNIPQHLWKCLNKMFWFCQGSKHAWLSYMFDKLLKMPQPEFWIWHGCICKGYTEFQICLIMAPYTSVMPENA